MPKATGSPPCSQLLSDQLSDQLVPETSRSCSQEAAGAVVPLASRCDDGNFFGCAATWKDPTVWGRSPARVLHFRGFDKLANCRPLAASLALC
jgi:hypothetical protein